MESYKYVCLMIIHSHDKDIAVYIYFEMTTQNRNIEIEKSVF